MTFTFQKLSFIGFYLVSLSWAFPIYAQSNSSKDVPAKKAQMASPETIPAPQIAEQPAPLSPNAVSDRINYFGIGGTIGLSDEGGTPQGEGGFSIVGRLSLTDNISIHTTSVIGEKSGLSVGITGGLPIRNQSTGRTLAFPFLGGGISIGSGTVDPLVTGGVDVPLGSNVTGTARINATFADDGTDIGLTFGIGVALF